MQKRTKAAALGGVTLAGIWAGTTQPAYADQDSSGTLYQTSTQDCLHYDDQFLANGGNPDRWTSTSSAQYAGRLLCECWEWPLDWVYVLRSWEAIREIAPHGSG